jgi:hypothetical protein
VKEKQNGDFKEEKIKDSHQAQPNGEINSIIFGVYNSIVTCVNKDDRR